ncbi:hypothetical protein [Saccharopolyspora sp. NPDC002376]
MSSGRCLRTFQGHRNRTAVVALDPDGRFGFSSGQDGPEMAVACELRCCAEPDPPAPAHRAEPAGGAGGFGSAQTSAD